MIMAMIFAAFAVLIGSIFLHMSYTYGILKGREQGLDEAEKIMKEVHDARLSEHGNTQR